MGMTTGYEKILAVIQKKKEKPVSEVSLRISQRIILGYCETSLKPQRFQPQGSEIGGDQTTSNSLANEDPEWVRKTVELAVTGRLTEPVPISVKSPYQNILGEGVWFCPDQMTADNKSPDPAFIPEELMMIIPLLTENKELATTLISAKRILGGTITDSSLSALHSAAPHECEADLEGFQGPPRDVLFEPAVSQSLDQDRDDIMQAARKLPAPGEHLVRIMNVLGYLYNFPEYTGPRARLEMEILDCPDAGKTLVDNISLPHQKESEGRRNRRALIASKLGLIPWGDKETRTIDWRSLQGVSCWVNVVHEKFKGRVFAKVTDYRRQQIQSG